MIDRINAVLLAGVVFLAQCAPQIAEARPRGGVTEDANSCGISSNTWCVAGNGWTVFSGTPSGSGTNCNTTTTTGSAGAWSKSATSTWTGTCMVAVSASGNDTTCRAQALTAGVTSATLSSFSPTLPCQTVDKAQSLIRNNTDDWLLLNKGDTWNGGFNGLTSGRLAWNGMSTARPMLIAAYGTGSRPTLKKVLASGDINCYNNQGTEGAYIAIVGIRCYGATSDPASSEYHGGTFTGTITSGSPTITGISPTLPSTFSDYSTKTAIYGNGIWLKLISGNPGGTNSLTMTTNASLSGSVTFQIASLYSQSGFGLTGYTNLLIVEDCEFYYSGVSITQNTAPVSAADVQYRFRRNIFNHAYANGNSANVFINENYPYSDAYVLFEENFVQYGGWDPDAWAFVGAGNTHCMYLHDPSPPYNLKKNIIANCSSTGVQWREGGTGYSNLFLNNPIQWSGATGFTNGSYSYNVYSNGSDIVCGLRLATADAASGTVLSVDGAVPSGNNCAWTSRIDNLSNPGSLPSTCVLSSVASTTTINLGGSGCTIGAGARGDGVKTGDQIIAVTTPNVWGVEPNATGGRYVNTGPALCTGGFAGQTLCYAATSTVSLGGSASSAITVTEPASTSKRQNDEIFKFTSGTLPTGLSLNTDYCSTGVSGLVYNIYLPTNSSGTNKCLGGSAIINSDGSSGSAVREGSRLFNFTTAYKSNWAAFTVPSWVTAGMTVCPIGPTSANMFTDNAGAAGCTSVSYVSTDRLQVVTTGGTVNGQFVGQSVAGAGQYALFFGGAANANNPAYTMTPNEVFANNLTRFSSSTAAIKLNQLYANGVNFSNAYIYNWDAGGTAANQILNTSTFSSSNSTTPVLNVAGSTSYPRASIEAYDASVSNRTATITIAPSGTGTGGVATVSAGSLTVGDTLFAADGSNTISQYQKVLKQLTGTTYALSVSQTVGTPTAVLGGSQSHFLAQAALQSKESGWNSIWTAPAAGNYIRTAIKCGDQVTFPGSPSCPLQ